MKGNLAGLMQQAQKMQAEMQKAQEELARLTVIGEAAGGLVKVTIEAGPVERETPARRSRRLEAERLADARARIAADPRVRSLLEDFEGELLEDSVTVHSHVDGSGHPEVDV
jgi:hypothetical protein